MLGSRPASSWVSSRQPDSGCANQPKEPGQILPTMTIYEDVKKHENIQNLRFASTSPPSAIDISR